MPTISKFLGIIIAMYYAEHSPPHFHVRYNQYKAAIRIRDFKLIKGTLPGKIHGLVVEWASMHQNELMQNWELAGNLQALNKISPLE